jgi:DNA polymerase-3 subunit gamma/tau
VKLNAPETRSDPDPGLADRWDGVVRQLARADAFSGLVRELAWQSALVHIEPGPPLCWHLRVAHESLRRPALQDKLCAALAATLGVELQIALEAGNPLDTPALRDSAERQRQQQAAEDEIRGDPWVQSLLTEFSGARIVPGSVKPVV